MNVRHLAALLRLLEKHPRVTSVHVGDLTLTLAAPETPPHVPETVEMEAEELSLPDGVLDPRMMLAEAQRKAAERKAAES